MTTIQLRRLGLADLDAIGRPRDAVSRSNVVPFPADLGKGADEIAALQEAGVERFYMRRTSDMPLDRITAFARRFMACPGSPRPRSPSVTQPRERTWP